MIERLALDEELLKELPAMTVGERIAAIREARGLKKSDLRKRAGIKSSTYVSVEKRNGLPGPRSLFSLARVLQVDPILVIKGENWRMVSSYSPDKEKISLLRLRKGWSQEELALALEKAGVDFRTTILDSKRTRINQWELGVSSPPYEIRGIVREVLGDDTLFSNSKRAEIGLWRVKNLEKKQGRGGASFEKMIRIIRLIISDLKATQSIRDARLVQASLNRKLAEIAG